MQENPVVHVDWKTAPLDPMGANDIGYLFANREMRTAAIRAGMAVDAHAPLSFCFESPMTYRRTRGGNKVEVLYTMFESPDFPEHLRPELRLADHVFVPTTFVRDLLAPFTQRRPVVVPLGYDPALFVPPATDRTWKPGESFRWLMVGAPNFRKGWDVVLDIWNGSEFGRCHDLHLYAKTVLPPDAIQTAIDEGWKRHESGVLLKGNIVLDPRRLTNAELVALYHSAHAFLYPTAGEGFGLTLLEAMATGLPAIVTRYSGVLDFTSRDTVRYVDWTPFYGEIVDPRAWDTGGVPINRAVPDPYQIEREMHAIMQRYRAAVRMGKQAARDVRQRFTWQHAGTALVRALESLATTPTQRAA